MVKEFNTTNVEQLLADALTKAHVLPRCLESAIAKFKDSLRLEMVGDIQKAMLGDKELHEAITEWAKTDEASQFLAVINSGAGASGNSSWKKGSDEQRTVDWELWAFIPQCIYWEAVALSIGLEPPKHGHDVKGWPSEYGRRLKITEAHIESKNLSCSNSGREWGTVELPVFGAWAKSLGWVIPDEFPRAKSLSNLASHCLDTSLPHYSKDLIILNEAASVFWLNADPAESETHPIKEKVIDWLKSKGFSDISAKQGAVIIRPEWAAKGRR